uniref:Butyrophilin subfamily 1 member A1-like n=1 Tax=Cyprinus carpio TaxID=7962 RepID=A0A8C1NCU9_CYPCA
MFMYLFVSICIFTGMMSIIIALLVNLLIETSVSLTVVVPGDPVVAHVGSTVILPCWISPAENAEALEIRWYRHDQFSNPVLLYNHGKIQDVQEESYRNRSSLTLRSDQAGGLKDGDVSLRLEKLTLQDEGSFHCYVSGDREYDSQQVLLKITALGSTPVLFPKPLDDGRVNISCRSSGWYPEPSVIWMCDDRSVLRPGGTSHIRGPDGMFFVQSWMAVSRSDAQLVSCSLSSRTEEFRESRIDVQAIISSGPWKALFFTLLIFALLSLGLVGFILYRYRERQTGKKPVGEIGRDENMEEQRKHADGEEETMEKLLKDVERDVNIHEQRKHEVVGDVNIEDSKKHADCAEETTENLLKDVVGDVNIEDSKKHADCEEETMEKLLKDVEKLNIKDSRKHEVVGDVNIEELRKHAVEITIDRERLHQDLKVSKDCKIVKASPDYNHTGEEFPIQLCAFGAQRFTSGRHYWEVELTQENTKNYWLIGVVKDGNLTARDRSTFTPFYGFWFLYSDGPRGFHINTNPPVKLPLTPRPERLGVLLDYDDGQLSFYNVTERKHLLTISSRFSGSVVPLFNPGAGDQSELRILDCPKPVYAQIHKDIRT